MDSIILLSTDRAGWSATHELEVIRDVLICTPSSYLAYTTAPMISLQSPPQEPFQSSDKPGKGRMALNEHHRSIRDAMVQCVATVKDHGVSVLGDFDAERIVWRNQPTSSGRYPLARSMELKVWQKSSGEHTDEHGVLPGCKDALGSHPARSAASIQSHAMPSTPDEYTRTTKLDTRAGRRDYNVEDNLILDQGHEKVKEDKIELEVPLQIDQPTLNLTDSPRTLGPIYFPPRSGCYISEFLDWIDPGLFRRIEALVGAWNVVLLDPPWPNKSAERANPYATFDPYVLGKFPLRTILQNTALPVLVGVWVTNKPKYKALVKTKLLKQWGVSAKTISEWYWLKLAEEGSPVVPIDSTSRRPYECLILGYHIPQSYSKMPPPIENNKIIMACSMGHSRKPNLLELFKKSVLLPTGQKNPNVLDFFSRMMLSPCPVMNSLSDGLYLSVGNEAVKFNDMINL